MKNVMRCDDVFHILVSDSAQDLHDLEECSTELMQLKQRRFLLINSCLSSTGFDLKVSHR